MPTSKRPLVLTILDGWGYRAATADNAIALARKPTYDKLLREYPNTLIRASEHFVGLPDGQMGISQPKVSALMRGDFSNLSESKLMECLNRFGYDIEIKLRPTKKTVGHRTLAIA